LRLKKIEKMKIFRMGKEDEGCDKINQALIARRIQLRSIPQNQSGVTTNP
jgi:hypothetical protein